MFFWDSFHKAWWGTHCKSTYILLFHLHKVHNNTTDWRWNPSGQLHRQEALGVFGHQSRAACRVASESTEINGVNRSTFLDRCKESYQRAACVTLASYMHPKDLPMHQPSPITFEVRNGWGDLQNHRKHRGRGRHGASRGELFEKGDTERKRWRSGKEILVSLFLLYISWCFKND